MNQTQHPPSISMAQTILLAVIAAIAMSGALAASARADQASDRREQTSYALETMNLHYPEYVARANDFRAVGCEKPPWGRPPPLFCHKPSPYNSFDWTTDGCSGTPPPARMVFNRPCQEHDFGYRNFGKGLTLERTEDRRAWIDGRFKSEMYRICRDPRASVPLGGYARCIAVATGMWGVVRNRSDWSKPCPPGQCHLPSSPPPPPPPPPLPSPPGTYSETTGGAANTWTNYSNAGGYQGPTIPSNNTVQISCKVTGFRVADGNTWWYRIASSPWNNAYYVSADAFYNNGQTSGSLHGTPFVDPNVRDC